MAKRNVVVARIFKQWDEKAKAWIWMREYVNKLTGKREVRVSPCQNGLPLKG